MRGANKPTEEAIRKETTTSTGKWNATSDLHLVCLIQITFVGEKLREGKETFSRRGKEKETFWSCLLELLDVIYILTDCVQCSRFNTSSLHSNWTQRTWLSAVLRHSRPLITFEMSHLFDWSETSSNTTFQKEEVKTYQLNDDPAEAWGRYRLTEEKLKCFLSCKTSLFCLRGKTLDYYTL